MHVRGDAVSGTWPQEAHRQPQIERTDAQLEILEKDSVTKPVKIEKIEPLFDGKINYQRHVLRCRIESEKQQNEILEIEALVYVVYSYLGRRELFKMAMLSTDFRKKFQE